MVELQITSKAKYIAVFWPAFVCAGVFAGLLFAFIDPVVLTSSLGIETSPRLAGYSITFLFFWTLGSISTYAAIAVLQTPDTRKQQ